MRLKETKDYIIHYNSCNIVKGRPPIYKATFKGTVVVSTELVHPYHQVDKFNHTHCAMHVTTTPMQSATN